METQPVLIYDGKCGFCGIWIRYWKGLTANQVVYFPSQEAGPRYPDITPEQFRRSVWLVLLDGDKFGGAEAVFRLMAYAPGKQWPLWWYRNIPGVRVASEAAYRLIAAHRDVFYWLTRIFWGKEVHYETFGRAAAIFLRGLGVIYFIAFASLLPQVTGLIGLEGILPATSYLHAIRSQIGIERFWDLPTLGWLSSGDTFLRFLCWAGMALSATLVAGFVPLAALAGLWLLYLSIANIGQDFLLFQWDALLVEAGFAALLLAPWGVRPRYRSDPPGLSRWVLRILLFRLMFESGLVKLLSGDPNWRNLTALNFHYETQPLPTPLAWYAHQLPAAFQKASVAGVFLVELAVPFLFVMPRRFRLLGAWITIVFELLIAATGNYTFFNLLTIVLCVLLLDDRHLGQKTVPPHEPRRWRAIPAIVAVFLIVTGTLQVLLPSRLIWIERAVEPWHIVNRYGLFAIMTTTRPEIVVEGSDDGEEWKAYRFKFKPGDVQQRPRWVAPYQPRLDWQMWFAALTTYGNTSWFTPFVVKLLEGSPPVLSLLETNPFPDHAPRFVRASLYQYHFSDAETRRKTGAWWTRTFEGYYFPPVHLR
jgi:predicted DCC family thiol-disulfide oxidoreductase YuxK